MKLKQMMNKTYKAGRIDLRVVGPTHRIYWEANGTGTTMKEAIKSLYEDFEKEYIPEYNGDHLINFTYEQFLEAEVIRTQEFKRWDTKSFLLELI